MSTPEVPVNPATLAWARKTTSATEEQAAKKAGVEVSRLRAWESGQEQPTLAQLRQLADLYKRPLAFFLLDQVPRDFTVLKSFRRMPDSDELALSFNLARQLRQALLRREIALDLFEAVGDEVRPVNLRASVSDTASKVATNVRAQLGVAESRQLGWSDEYEAFRTWRGAVENLGILTFQVAQVDMDEMRGLSVFQPVLPLVLLNTGDAVRGRIFTLMHELGHLLLRTSATKDSNAALIDPHEDIEVWCNEFAGTLLVPPSLLTWTPREVTPAQFDWGELKVQAARLKVSREVVLRRLLATGRITHRQHQALRRELVRLSPPARVTGGPMPQDVKVVSRLGTSFVRAVLIAYRQNKITLNDVSGYLDVRVKYVPAIQERVLRSQTGAGGAEA
jgi:Zn-dependent peptidase ImmA (M78 family)